MCGDKWAEGVDFKVLLLVYQALHDQATEYVRVMLQERTNVLTLHSTVSSQLAVPWSRLKGFGDWAFGISSQRLSNLPGSITDCKFIDAFFKSLKTHLY